MPLLSSPTSNSELEDALVSEPTEAELPLMSSSESLVSHLKPDRFTVDAEHLGTGGRGRASAEAGEREALATPPCQFSATLSDNFKPGEPFSVQGPHGLIKVEAPADAKPGTSLRYKLAPKPDFRVQVPPGAQPGSMVAFKRADGVKVTVPVPRGLAPGDTFEVSPPALMVRVPESAKAGETVVFRSCREGEQEATWFRAPVPEGLEPGKYFTARLPLPKSASKPVAEWTSGQESPRVIGSNYDLGPMNLLRMIQRAAYSDQGPLAE